MSDITAEIKRYDSVTEEAKADFEALMKESEGYEPYFDTGHPMYMAYIDGEPVGILTYLVTSENETEPDGVDHADGSDLFHVCQENGRAGGKRFPGSSLSHIPASGSYRPESQGSAHTGLMHMSLWFSPRPRLLGSSQRPCEYG